jgi:hypothetical protein
VEPARVITQRVFAPGVEFGDEAIQRHRDIGRDLAHRTLLLWNVPVSASDARKGSGIVGSGSSHQVTLLRWLPNKRAAGPLGPAVDQAERQGGTLV